MISAVNGLAADGFDKIPGDILLRWHPYKDQPAAERRPGEG
jgi:hypothetical protein